MQVAAWLNSTVAIDDGKVDGALLSSQVSFPSMSSAPSCESGACSSVSLHLLAGPHLRRCCARLALAAVRQISSLRAALKQHVGHVLFELGTFFSRLFDLDQSGVRWLFLVSLCGVPVNTCLRWQFLDKDEFLEVYRYFLGCAVIHIEIMEATRVLSAC